MARGRRQAGEAPSREWNGTGVCAGARVYSRMSSYTEVERPRTGVGLHVCAPGRLPCAYWCRCRSRFGIGAGYVTCNPLGKMHVFTSSVNCVSGGWVAGSTFCTHQVPRRCPRPPDPYNHPPVSVLAPLNTPEKCILRIGHVGGGFHLRPSRPREGPGCLQGTA